MSDLSSAPMVLPELRGPTGRLYGRDDELAVIAGAWARARDGCGQVVFVEAAAGQGKSSLVAHAAQAAVGGGKPTRRPRLLFGAAHRDSYLSFEPFNLTINQWCAHADIDDLRRTVDGSVGPTLKSMVPALWERITNLADPPQADIAGLEMRVVDAVTGFFANLTRLGPVVCVLEDLHWADEDTVRLLAELLAASRDWPMLVIATARPNEMSSALEELRTSLVGRDEFVAVELGPLSPEVTAMVIADAIGKQPAADTVAEIQRATGGNAMWIVEVAHRLTDHGVVADDWETGIVEDLPGTLIETIKTRLGGMDPQTTSLVAYASVLGTVIDPQVLANLAGMPVGQVLAGLQIAEHRALVHPPDGAGHFRFAHPLIESTLYDSLDGVRSKRGHRRAGLALEQQLGDQAFSHAPVLAHHFTKAGPAYASKAFTYSALAGQSAFGVAAYERALHHFDAALALVHTVEPAQKDAIEIQLTMGKAMATALLRGTNHPRAVELFAHVAALVEDLPVSPELLTPLAWLWAENHIRSDFAMMKHYQAKLLAASESLPPGPDRLFALWVGVENAAIECDFEAADQWAGRCMAVIDDPDFVDSAQLMSVTGEPVSLSHLTWALMLNLRADDPKKARRVMERGESLIERAAEPIRPTAQYAAALTRWTRRDVAEVEQIATEGIEICDRLKLVQWRAVLQAFQGWAQAMRGDPAGAARCRDGVDAWHSDGANASSSLWATMVAEAGIAVEQPQLAYRFVERAFEIQSRTHEPFLLPSLIRVKAELAVLDPGLGDPEQLYRQALALAQQQGAQLLELQVAVSMTQWSRSLGHQILTDAVTKIGADVDLPDINAARALLGP